MSEPNFAQTISVWLGTTKHNRIFITKSNNHYSLHITTNKGRRDHKFAIIGDDYIAVPPGKCIEAADPNLFSKLENIIKNIEEVY